MTLGDVAARDPGDLAALGYSDELTLAGQRLPLHYVFEPGHDADGITVTVPRSLLGAIRPVELEWLVPAWLRDKVIAYLRALPKEQRRAARAVARYGARRDRRDGRAAGRQSVVDCARGSLREVRRVEIAPSAFDERLLPVHLRLRVAVVDADGRVLAQAASSPRCSASSARRRRQRAVEAAPARWHARGSRVGISATCRRPSSSRSGRKH